MPCAPLPWRAPLLALGEVQQIEKEKKKRQRQKGLAARPAKRVKKLRKSAAQIRAPLEVEQEEDEDAKEEGEEDDEADVESEADSSTEESDDQDEAQEESDSDGPVDREAAVVDGDALCLERPTIDKDLVGRHLLFRFRAEGWLRGVINRSKLHDSSRQNFEILYDDGDIVSQLLAPLMYGGQEAGSWILLNTAADIAAQAKKQAKKARRGGRKERKGRR